MKYNYNNSCKDFSVDISVNIENEEQKKFVCALGNLIISNLSLINTKLLNTCINLININAGELLENLADYVNINGIEVNNNVKKIIDEFSNIDNFSI